MGGLGIDPIQLGAQIINFTILLFVLKKLLYKPVLSMLEKREAEIKEGLSLKEKVEERKEKLEQEQKKLRAQIREEERRVMKQAVTEAKKREKEILEEAKKEIRAERDKMMAEVNRERTKTLEQAKKQSLEFAVSISEKLLGKKLDQSEQKVLLEDALSELNKK